MLTNADALFRLLRALASLGVFAETEPGWFTLTPLAHFLRRDTSDSMWATVIMNGEEHYQAWGDLLYSVQTGKNSFEHLYGMQLFSFYAQNPEPAKIFDQAMTSHSNTETAGVVAGYRFSDIRTVVDVAGGHGNLIAGVLQANPHLKGILFDQPAVIQGAKLTIQAAGVLDRCRLEAGDFFESLPAGGDAYMLKHIVHDWDDERASAILKCCYNAMPRRGKLLVIERAIPTGNSPSIGKLMDLNMLVTSSGGRERTEAEYRSLFKGTGFKLTRVVTTQAPISIFEGVRE